MGREKENLRRVTHELQEMTLSRLILTRIKRADLQKIFIGILILSIAIFVGGVGYFVFLIVTPSVETLKDYRPNTLRGCTRTKTRSSRLLHGGSPDHFRPDVPPVVINAFIASEDARFFHHQVWTFSASPGRL